MTLKGMAMALTVLVLAGCAGPQLSDYADSRPVLDFRSYFDGPLKAYGVVRNRSGQVIRSFDMDLVGRWEGEVGTLQEEIRYDDGEVQHRAWTLRPDGPGRYRATADDVVGTGSFRSAGRAMRLDYVLQVDYRGRKLNLKVEDWLWLQPDDLIINQSILTKFGFRVGDILTTMIKPPP